MTYSELCGGLGAGGGAARGGGATWWGGGGHQLTDVVQQQWELIPQPLAGQHAGVTGHPHACVHLLGAHVPLLPVLSTRCVLNTVDQPQPH